MIHLYTRENPYLIISKQEFPRVSSHGLKWGNKPSKLKRVCIIFYVRARGKPNSLIINKHMNKFQKF